MKILNTALPTFIVILLLAANFEVCAQLNPTAQFNLFHNNSPVGIESTAFSPDGKLLFLGGQAQNAIIWNVETGEKNNVNAHPYVISSAFSLDGERLVTGNVGTTVKVWDVRTGDSLMTKETPTNFSGVRSVSISDDKQWGVAGYDNNIIIWNIVTGEELYRFVSLIHSYIKNLQFMPNKEEIFISGDRGNEGCVFNLKTGQITRQFADLEKGSILSWDRQEVITLEKDLEGSESDLIKLKIWKVSSGEVSKSFNNGIQGLKLFSSRSFNKKFVIAKSALTILDLSPDRVTDLATLNVNGEEAIVRDIKISPNGKRVVAISEDYKTAYVYDVSDLITVIQNFWLHR